MSAEPEDDIILTPPESGPTELETLRARVSKLQRELIDARCQARVSGTAQTYDLRRFELAKLKLEDRIGELEQERDEALADYQVMADAQLESQHAYIQASEQNRQLREAFVKYGQHAGDCKSMMPAGAGFPGGTDCNCGFDSVLSGAPTANRDREDKP